VKSAAYLRVSSSGQSLAMQRLAIERAALARRDKISRWYAEKISTGKASRPELERLQNDARGGLVARVYCYRLDRLSRGGIRETLAIVQDLKASGCELVTLADGFTLGGPGDEVVLAVLAWAAQMERAAIGERIKSARLRVESAGGQWGRPRRVDDAQAARVRELKSEGRSVRAIAIALKIPRTTVGEVVAEKGAYSRASKRRRKARLTP